MSVEVVPFGPSQRAEWDAFVEASNNGTLFHLQAFFDYHPAGRFPFHHLLFRREGKIIALLPGALDDGKYQSPAGASFGGFVVPEAWTLRDADAVVAAFLDYCRAQGIRRISLTPPLQVYQARPDEAMDFALLRQGFTLTPPLYSSVIDLARVHNRDPLSWNTRHKIQKAENKGVRVVAGNDFDTFYPILLENKAKHGARPAHTLEELKRLDALLPGRLILTLAYVEKEPVAGQLLFVANRTCVLNFYTMHRYEYRNYFGVNLLVEQGLRWCAERGHRWYDYGVSGSPGTDDPTAPAWSLIDMKESMGSTGCIRKTFALQLE